MKKVTFIMIMLLAVVSCSSKFGKGGENAAQYVREQLSDTKNIKSIEAKEEVDFYVLNRFACERRLDSLELGVVTIDDETYNKTVDIADEIREGIGSNDSTKAPGEMRKMYIVTITYKSTKQDVRQVIMKRDGITPFMTLEEYEDHITPLKEKLDKYLIKMILE